MCFLSDWINHIRLVIGLDIQILAQQIPQHVLWLLLVSVPVDIPTHPRQNKLKLEEQQAWITIMFDLTKLFNVL